MTITRCTLEHIFWEGNKVADRLANLEVDQKNKMVPHIITPNDIIPQLEACMREVAFFFLSIDREGILYICLNYKVPAWKNYINGESSQDNQVQRINRYIP